MWFRRFSTCCIALLVFFCLCITSYAEPSEEGGGAEDLEALPNEEPVVEPDLPVESVELPEVLPEEPPVDLLPDVPEIPPGPEPSLPELPPELPPEPVQDDDQVTDELPSGPSEPVEDDSQVTDELPLGPSEPEGPLQVIVLPEDTPFADLPSFFSSRASVPEIGSEPPANPPFYGACYVTGLDSRLGRVTVYFPSTYKSGYFGVDANGYLFNVSASSITGYLSGVYNNSVSAAGFNYPRYRVYSGSSYNYVDLQLRPEHSNMGIAVSNAPRYSVDDLTPYLILLVGGVLFLCFMKRS